MIQILPTFKFHLSNTNIFNQCFALFSLFLSFTQNILCFVNKCFSVFSQNRRFLWKLTDLDHLKAIFRKSNLFFVMFQIWSIKRRFRTTLHRIHCVDHLLFSIRHTTLFWWVIYFDKIAWGACILGYHLEIVRFFVLEDNMSIYEILFENICHSRCKLCQNYHMSQFKFEVKSLQQKGNIFEIDHIRYVAPNS